MSLISELHIKFPGWCGPERARLQTGDKKSPRSFIQSIIRDVQYLVKLLSARDPADASPLHSEVCRSLTLPDLLPVIAHCEREAQKVMGRIDDYTKGKVTEEQFDTARSSLQILTTVMANVTRMMEWSRMGVLLADVRLEDLKCPSDALRKFIATTQRILGLDSRPVTAANLHESAQRQMDDLVSDQNAQPVTDDMIIEEAPLEKQASLQSSIPIIDHRVTQAYPFLHGERMSRELTFLDLDAHIHQIRRDGALDAVRRELREMSDETYTTLVDALRKNKRLSESDRLSKDYPRHLESDFKLGRKGLLFSLSEYLLDNVVPIARELEKMPSDDPVREVLYQDEGSIIERVLEIRSVALQQSFIGPIAGESEAEAA